MHDYADVHDYADEYDYEGGEEYGHEDEDEYGHEGGTEDKVLRSLLVSGRASPVRST